MRTPRLLRLPYRACLLCLALLAGATAPASAAEIGFIEQFALADDRSVPLAELIPGTEEYYYYHCLYAQQRQQWDRVADLLKSWEQRLGRSAGWIEIQHRQQLLTYSQNPQATLAYLRQQLGLRFDHQRQTFGRSPDLPTELDPQHISRETLTQRARQQQPNLSGFEDAALWWLIEQELNDTQRRELLSRWQWPNHPRLLDRLLEDLRDPDSPRLGGYPIHSRLLRAQLDQLAQALPEVRSNETFVHSYLVRLQPDADTSLAEDLQARAAYLQRLGQFGATLPLAWNSLKANIAYHRLELDRRLGTPDRQRLIEYLRLPRQVPYVNPEYLRRPENRGAICDLNASYEPHLLLPPVRDDEPLVRALMLHFLADVADYDAWTEYFREDYLKQLFAEAKITAGRGRPEQWASLLSPEQYQALRDRVDIQFAATNLEYFAPDDVVMLDLWVKNVPELLVKIYRLNAENFFRQNGTQVNTDINLDGLTPGQELRLQYDEPATHRVLRHLVLDGLSEPGTYVVDFIGNGQSSRALIRKGRLSYTEQLTAAGHQLRVYDQQGRHQSDATVWLGGRYFTADSDGNILIPYSGQPGNQPIILSSGRQVTLERLEHRGESYRLEAGILVDREQLIQHRRATIVLRPQLLLNDHRVAISLLEEPRLEITTTDLDGVSSIKTIDQLELSDGDTTELQFQVPPRAISLNVRLAGQVKNLSQANEQDVATERAFQFNAIDQTQQIECVYLIRDEHQWLLQVLGKTGEPQSDRVVNVQLKHHDFREEVTEQLKTDPRGVIHLGSLPQIDAVTATPTYGGSRRWELDGDHVLHYQRLHLTAGEPLRVPYVGRAQEVTAEEFGLYALRLDQPAEDLTDRLQLVDRYVVCDGLPGGDYLLRIRSSGQQFQLRVAEGQVDGGYVVGPRRRLERRGDPPLQILGVVRQDESLMVQLAGATADTRLLVVANRYQPSFPLFEQLATVRDAELAASYFPWLPSATTSGRNIGDEYRYVLQRQLLPRYPGNMLPRPELLINPWQLQETQTDVQVPAAEEPQAPASAAPDSSSDRGESRQERVAAAGDLPNLDFLPESSTVLTNLTPDADGRVRIPLEDLGDRHDLHLLAISTTRTVYHRHTGAAHELQPLDLRLADTIDPERHAVMFNRSKVLQAGETLTLPAGRDARWEIYDQLSKVHQVLAAASGNPELAKFQFLLGWDQLSDEQKRKYYTQFACHELHFFLYRRDREFYDRVVAPLLRNKLEQTFVDHWLLERPLTAYTALAARPRLNTWEDVLLATRLEQLEALRRRLSDLESLQPPDPQQQAALFHFAVNGLLANERTGSLSEALSWSDKGVTMDFFDAGQPEDATSFEYRGRGGRWGRPARALGLSEAAAADDALGAVRLELLDAAAAEGLDSIIVRGSRADVAKALSQIERLSAGEAAREKIARDLFFISAGQTKEWAESQYYHVLRTAGSAQLAPLNPFWLEYARREPSQPFLSAQFLQAQSSLNEMLLALAVIDLPFQAAEHDVQVVDNTLTLTAGSPAIVYFEDLQYIDPADDSTGVLVDQNFFDPQDRYRQIEGQQVERFVTGELLTDHVYGCKVVVTNTTSLPTTVDLLLQIPEGAMPVAGARQTRSATVRLEPYQTQNIEYLFYFPAPGQFPQFPVHVREGEQLIAFADARTLPVVDELSEIDRTSWQYISQQGTDQEVLDYLRSANLYRTDLNLIAFRLKDEAFFDQLCQLLDERQYYHATVWSYAIQHNQPPRIRTYLAQQPGFVQQCGLQLHSPLLVIDAQERDLYEHLEYHPLINARIHQLGQQREILNDRFHAQYHRWLKLLSYQTSFSAEDQLATVSYLLLQDRVTEALQRYQNVQPNQLDSRLQYDYLTAYLDFYTETPSHARSIAEQYRDYPVDHWREAFSEVLRQLDQIEGVEASLSGADNPFVQQEGLASREPTLSLQVEGRSITLDLRNISQLTLNYYLIDAELLFSRKPFAGEQGQFAVVEPNQTDAHEVPEGQTRLQLELPEELANRNLYVEAVAAGKTVGQLHYANSLQVAVSDRYGQLLVRDAQSDRPLPKTYVKVYSQDAGGNVEFFKDGYTDLRGRFDYATLSTDQLNRAQRLAILVLSDTHGALVREVLPPQQ